MKNRNVGIAIAVIISFFVVVIYIKFTYFSGNELHAEEKPSQVTEGTDSGNPKLNELKETSKNDGKPLHTCPMHPQIIMNEPGQCPICGMDLVPKDKEEKGATKTNSIIVDPVTVQNMGIRLDKVKKGDIFRHIRSYGRVEIPDDRINVVNLRFSGWVEKIWVDRVGDYVKKGEKLFAMYSPEIYAAEKEYLMALKNYGEESEITESARERLRLWNVPSWIVKKIKKEKKPERLITITAPSSGYIHKKSIVKGSRVKKGINLYTIYDLKKVWVKAEVYEFDISWLKKGAKALVKFSAPGQRSLEGKVSYIYPTLNEKARTMTVRVELDNKDASIKPGMVATVLIYAEGNGGRLVIPTESIIDTGSKKIVFVTEKRGNFEARKIETGLVGDNDVTEITDGLHEGEKIVLSGQFLLDSESQLKEAVEKFLHQKLQGHGSTGSQDGHTGHNHEKKSEDGKTPYICPMHPQIIEEEPGSCPICGMDLVEKKLQQE